jgi:hypothetical protein
VSFGITRAKGASDVTVYNEVIKELDKIEKDSAAGSISTKSIRRSNRSSSNMNRRWRCSGKGRSSRCSWCSCS